MQKQIAFISEEKKNARNPLGQIRGKFAKSSSGDYIFFSLVNIKDLTNNKMSREFAGRGISKIGVPIAIEAARV